MERRIQVIVKKAGLPPELTEIEDTAERLHEVVGGCFDIGCPFPSVLPNVVGICKDVSFFDGSHLNFVGECQPWFGTVVLAGCEPGAEDFDNLSAYEIAALRCLLG